MREGWRGGKEGGSEGGEGGGREGGGEEIDVEEVEGGRERWRGGRAVKVLCEKRCIHTWVWTW